MDAKECDLEIKRLIETSGCKKVIEELFTDRESYIKFMKGTEWTPEQRKILDQQRGEDE